MCKIEKLGYALLIVDALILSSCSIGPVRDAIGYTETKCSNMGFVKGTEAHANCQLQLEMQYSRNAALKGMFK